MGRWLIIILLLSLPATALSDPLRIATYNASLNRSGPGLLLRAIEKNKDAQIKNVIGIIQHIRPDILLINEIDWDVENRAAKAFISALNSGDAPIHYPHFFTSEPNSGRLSGMRLSSKSHWDVPVNTPNGPLHIYASHPTPPVFDGPEDRNGLRNADEIRFWSLYLNGTSFTDDQTQNAQKAKAQNKPPQRDRQTRDTKPTQPKTQPIGTINEGLVTYVSTTHCPPKT